MLYHAKVYLPKSVLDLVPSSDIMLEYSEHAMEQRSERQVSTKLPTRLNPRKGFVFEVETAIDGSLVKFGVRVRGNGKDCVFIVGKKREAQGYIVRTLWENESGDTHKTLDRTKYVKRPSH